MADEKKIITLPKGRIINHSLFKLDQYVPERGEPGEPRYQVEVAFPKNAKGEDSLEAFMDEIIALANETWAKDIPDGGWLMNVDAGPGEAFDLISGIQDGDKKAAKREKQGKVGDAYKGMWVVNATTIYDMNGQKQGTAGARVWDENVEPLTPVRSAEVYNGCYAVMAVTLGTYVDSKSDVNGIKVYLSAIQKVDEGDRLTTPQDTSKLFKPVGRKTGGTTEAGAAKPAGRRGARTT